MQNSTGLSPRKLLKPRLFKATLGIALLALGLRVTASAEAAEAPQSADVVVYGGTAAGVAAAVQAARMGKSVVLIEPGKHLGGLTSGGLGFTDTGKTASIGGMSREFYQRIWTYYNQPEAWTWQRREDFGDKGQGVRATDHAQRTMWIFEPHVAEKVLNAMIAEAKVPVVFGQRLELAPGKGVSKTGPAITSIRMESGTVFAGKMFIDASYEGDLMAKAGVAYHVGREANATYKETWNGIQVGTLHHNHFFKNPVDPYVVAGDPKSGLLPLVSAADPGKKGEADKRVQAYCFRMCLTNVPENRLPITKPEGYTAGTYELLLRTFASGWKDVFGKFDAIPNGKTDTNNCGPFSFDHIGMNYDYPDGDYATRERIIRDHETYQKGLLYFLANDPRVPQDIREKMSQWGYPKDEFTDNGNWSHQLYIREARRMIGSYVMTEHDCLSNISTPQSVGMGSYTMDSHNVQRYVTSEGFVQNEGDVGAHPKQPYKIAFGAILPKAEQCQNLLVPVCASTSHIAYGSVRMEPVFMILGQSAATAACLALDENVPLQSLKYDTLRQRLLADGQILDQP